MQWIRRFEKKEKDIREKKYIVRERDWGAPICPTQRLQKFRHLRLQKFWHFFAQAPKFQTADFFSFSVKIGLFGGLNSSFWRKSIKYKLMNFYCKVQHFCTKVVSFFPVQFWTFLKKLTFLHLLPDVQYSLDVVWCLIFSDPARERTKLWGIFFPPFSFYSY